jgi:hypothetical protein
MSAGQRRLNRRLFPFLPEVSYWVRLGMHPRTARSLVEAGIRSVVDLAGWCREDVLALPWVGQGCLIRLEQLRGSLLPSRKSFWVERGMGPVISNALLRAGIDSLEKLGALTQEEFLSFYGLGPKALRECERALGRPLDSPYPSWCRLGLRPRTAYRLSRAGIRAPQELVAQPLAALRALGLSGQEIELCRALADQHAAAQEGRR